MYVRISADAAMLHEIKKNQNNRLDESINDEKDGVQKIALDIASVEEEAEAEAEHDRSTSSINNLE